mmetsp:Transcript_6353/g.23496  ORF Transcript_6353/g.23496 Transcript_6353/m.23496 type:complete len:238 (+) Transcript_6353:1562-2275(+)
MARPSVPPESPLSSVASTASRLPRAPTPLLDKSKKPMSCFRIACRLSRRIRSVSSAPAISKRDICRNTTTKQPRPIPTNIQLHSAALVVLASGSACSWSTVSMCENTIEKTGCLIPLPIAKKHPTTSSFHSGRLYANTLSTLVFLSSSSMAFASSSSTPEKRRERPEAFGELIWRSIAPAAMASSYASNCPATSAEDAYRCCFATSSAKAPFAAKSSLYVPCSTTWPCSSTAIESAP